jgi:hypothetical protein
MEVSGKLHALAALPPPPQNRGETPIPIEQGAGGPQNRSGRFEEKGLSLFPGFETRIVHPVTSRYTIY